MYLCHVTFFCLIFKSETKNKKMSIGLITRGAELFSYSYVSDKKTSTHQIPTAVQLGELLKTEHGASDKTITYLLHPTPLTFSALTLVHNETDGLWSSSSKEFMAVIERLTRCMTGFIMADCITGCDECLGIFSTGPGRKAHDDFELFIQHIVDNEKGTIFDATEIVPEYAAEFAKSLATDLHRDLMAAIIDCHFISRINNIVRRYEYMVKTQLALGIIPVWDQSLIGSKGMIPLVNTISSSSSSSSSSIPSHNTRSRKRKRKFSPPYDQIFEQLSNKLTQLKVTNTNTATIKKHDVKVISEVLNDFLALYEASINNIPVLTLDEITSDLLITFTKSTGPVVSSYRSYFAAGTAAHKNNVRFIRLDDIDTENGCLFGCRVGTLGYFTGNIYPPICQMIRFEYEQYKSNVLAKTLLMYRMRTTQVIVSSELRTDIGTVFGRYNQHVADSTRPASEKPPNAGETARADLITLHKKHTDTADLMATNADSLANFIKQTQAARTAMDEKEDLIKIYGTRNDPQKGIAGLENLLQKNAQSAHTMSCVDGSRQHIGGESRIYDDDALDTLIATTDNVIANQINTLNTPLNYFAPCDPVQQAINRRRDGFARHAQQASLRSNVELSLKQKLKKAEGKIKSRDNTIRKLDTSLKAAGVDLFAAVTKITHHGAKVDLLSEQVKMCRTVIQEDDQAITKLRQTNDAFLKMINVFTDQLHATETSRDELMELVTNLQTSQEASVRELMKQQIAYKKTTLGGDASDNAAYMDSVNNLQNNIADIVNYLVNIFNVHGGGLFDEKLINQKKTAEANLLKYSKEAYDNQLGLLNVRPLPINPWIISRRELDESNATLPRKEYADQPVTDQIALLRNTQLEIHENQTRHGELVFLDINPVTEQRRINATCLMDILNGKADQNGQMEFAIVDSNSPYTKRFMGTEQKTKGNINIIVDEPLNKKYTTLAKNVYRIGERMMTESSQFISGTFTDGTISRFINSFSKLYTGERGQSTRCAYLSLKVDMSLYTIDTRTGITTIPDIIIDHCLYEGIAAKILETLKKQTFIPRMIYKAVGHKKP